MEFNKLFNLIIEGGFRAPIDTKRPIKAPNAKNHGSISPYLNNKSNPAAYSGFKGDSRNPAMSTVVFPLPKKKIKRRVKK